jgi:hypothetical protein
LLSMLEVTNLKVKWRKDTESKLIKFACRPMKPEKRRKSNWWHGLTLQFHRHQKSSSNW